MFWGLSPSLDLCEQYKNTHNNHLPQELNILLIGGQDSRHIIHTLAKRYKHPTKTTLKFHIIEGSVELIARQLLLLNVALQDELVLGLIPKVRIFMELYGNTLVRPSVAKYLTATSTTLLEMLTNPKYLADKMPYVSIDLKYKERDHMENLFKFWCDTKQEFDVCDAWDRRMRKMLGVRYDAKLGAFDWDLNMRLHSVGGAQVCAQEYRSFRRNGVAFSWLESEVASPNRSLVGAVVPNGERFIHCGYLGEMQTGPFVAFGLSCADAEYLQSTNGRNSYRATDVTERNLCELFYELQNNEQYVHQGLTDYKLGAVTLREEETRLFDANAPIVECKTSRNCCIGLENVEIRFVSITHLDLMKFREEYRKLFDVIYFGNCYLKYMSKELIESVMVDGGLLVVENQKFVLSHRDKQLKEFEEEINKAMDGIQVKNLNFDVCKDNFAKFVKS